MSLRFPRLAIAAMLCVLASPAALAGDLITSVKGKQVELFDTPDDASRAARWTSPACRGPSRKKKTPSSR